jgi:pimeloyl-ACP methyl ester carboxylesterase
VSVDLTLLEQHRRYEDDRRGISEELLQPVIGGARTVAVLSRPTGPQHHLGFVLCPSFGSEHTQLNGLEVVVARAVAAAGFPVLRYQSQGYADSEGPRDAIGVRSHLADAADAVEALSARDEVRSVAVMGGLFGGTVAALTAERLGLRTMALWEPAVDGGRYAERLLRSLALPEVAAPTRGDGRPPLTRLRERLASGAPLDVRGFVLTNDAFDELHAIDLTRDLASFDGRSLVLGVSRSGRPAPGVTTLAEHLERLGGAATTVVVKDKLVHPLGAFRFAPMAERPGRVDMHFALNVAVADATVAWARSLPAVDEATA